MIANKETTYTKDLDNKRILVSREFDAPVSEVWKAWTDPEILEKWWAPKPWKAVSHSMDFKEGGQWLYYMQGPEGEKHYCRMTYTTIHPKKEYMGEDGFCDENWNPSTELPNMHWKTQFTESGAGTRVDVEVSFDSLEDLEKIVEMGFQEGFAAAHQNLDEVLLNA